MMYSLDLIIGFSAFWFIENAGFTEFINSLRVLLSGSLFPLFLLSKNFNFIEYLPPYADLPR